MRASRSSANHNQATYYTGPLPASALRHATPAPRYCGYPGDEWGWAVISGTEIKLDFLSPGSRFGVYFNYGVGASAYGGGSNLTSPGLFGSGNQIAFGVITDCGLRQRLEPAADHVLDGRRRVRILLDAQLLEHDLRQRTPKSATTAPW